MRKLFIAGHRGMVGSALVRKFSPLPDYRILTAPRSSLDLFDSSAVDTWFEANRPDIVIVAAARVGGIVANRDNSYGFLVDNLRISTNVIDACKKYPVSELVMLGSSCIYPKYSQQPIQELELLTGPLEPTNEGYALAKICALRQCQYVYEEYGINAYSVMPPNLYGPNDNYDVSSSHVMASFIRRFTEAVRINSEYVQCWGTGSPRREFMHVDDLVNALDFLLRLNTKDKDSGSVRDALGKQRFINIGVDSDISIMELAALVAETAGYKGEILWDDRVPDGTPQKLMDSSKIRSLGWSPSIALKQGVSETLYQYLNIADV